MGLLLSLLKAAAGETSLFSSLGRWQQAVSTKLDHALVMIEPSITQVAWAVDAVNGDDNASGTPAEPLLTLGELARRWNGKTLDSPLYDVKLIGSFPQEALIADLTILGPTVLTFSGVVTEVATGSIEAFVTMNAAGGVRAALTDTSQDFTKHVQRRIRLVSGTNTGATAWICSLGSNFAVANVTDFLAQPSAANSYAPLGSVVPVAGDQYVVESLDTSCASHQLRLKGFPIYGRSACIVRDMRFVSALSLSTCFSRASQKGSLCFYGCEYTADVGNISFNNCSLSHRACSMRSSSDARVCVYVGGDNIEFNCALFCYTVLDMGARVGGQRNIHDGDGVRNASRTVDAGSVCIETQHRGFFGCLNTAAVSELIFVLDASHWVAEGSGGLFWGTGNATTRALSVRNNCSFVYNTLPTATGAVVGDDVVLAGEAPRAWSTIPALATAPNNAAINLRQ